MTLGTKQRDDVAAMIKIAVDALEAKYDALEAKYKVEIKKRDDEIKIRDEKIAELIKKAAAPANAWFKKPEAEIYFLAKVRQEQSESERIKRNVIISGIPETGNDENEKLTNDNGRVEEVLNAVGLSRNTVQRQVRLRSPMNPNAKLILVEFTEVEHRDTALKRSGVLKTNQSFKDVYLNQDMTKAERVAERDLRKERNELNASLPDKDGVGRQRGEHNGRKFYWGIRSGELRRIYDRTTA
jgi:hypothetical protein